MKNYDRATSEIKHAAARNMTTGEKIIKIRESKDVSQAELARRCGVRPSHIMKIEKSHYKNCRVETFRKIADALGVSFSEIYP